MNDFEGLLNTDFGFKPSGKSVPISGSASTKGSTNLNSNYDLGSLGQSRSTRNSNSFNGSLPDDRDRDSIFGQPSSQKSQDFSGLGDILGGSTRYSSKSETRGADAAFNLDSMFGSSTDTGAKSSTNSEPVFDKPVYDDDDDIFDGVPGLKSSSSKIKYDDVFSSLSSSPPKGSSAFDDLLGGFGKSESQSKSFGVKGSEKTDKAVPAFDDLLPGFGGSTPSTQRSGSGANFASENTINVTKSKSNVMDNPFVVTGDFSDPLEEMNKLSNSGSMKKDHSVDNGAVFDGIDPFGDLGKSIPAFSSERNSRGKERNTERAYSNTSGTKTFSSSKEPIEKPSVRIPDSQSQKKVPFANDWDSRQTMFDMPPASTDSHKHTSQSGPPSSYARHSFKDENMMGDRSIRYEENLDSSEDVWLTVSDIPLFTQPTIAPPPSRPPPPRPVQVSKAGSSSPASANTKRKPNEFSSFPNSNIPKSAPASSSQIDDLENLTTGRSQNNVDEHGNGLAGEELEMNSAAAAMKEAMDRAEAKFRHAKEVREREGAKAARSRETQMEKDDKEERWDREQLYREREEEEMEQKKLEREREWEEKERELKRLEKERERAREIEREREKARQAVERATREARERAAIEARLRAERAKAEKAAVERANAEARERAERAAVQRAQAEARERAAAEARERAEKAAADRTNAEAKEREARERAAAAKAEADARARAEQRSAVERAAAEARERASVEARERAAAAARASQQKNENDLESFFAMGRASSAPRPRENSSTKHAETPKASSVSSANMRKVSSTTNIVDDLSSIFGAAPSSGDFQEVEGESEERRRARLERHQKAHERVARALAEKNERDLQNQRDQAERNRIGETLDAEIKRWAAGKEGNLRALLSTLQYVLWPECGWQPVSLTDLITAASVKKAYRKATLCIHPDKVQQKGANLQQKYVAEKVFDLLKEAWNKLNSEELF